MLYPKFVKFLSIINFSGHLSSTFKSGFPENKIMLLSTDDKYDMNYYFLFSKYTYFL